jgi:hypothetical protein
LRCAGSNSYADTNPDSYAEPYTSTESITNTDAYTGADPALQKIAERTLQEKLRSHMTKPELTAKLQEWGKLTKQRNKIEAEADGQLEDLIVTFERKAEPINAERDRKLQPFLEQLQTLENELRDEMLRNVKADGTIGIPQLETALALAQVHASSKREIDAAAFIRATPPRRRTDPGFYACLTVQIGKAEKFLDQPTMLRLARPKVTHSVAITLKG